MKHGHRATIGALVVVALVVGTMRPVVAATQIDIVGPAGSGAFGTSVKVLPNGNIVVTDPYYDNGAAENVGAVYLYHGSTGTLISALTGSTAGDRVGQGGVTVLSNSNYVVQSWCWHSDAGAVTWGDGTTGVSGVVSAANSLVGSTTGDQIGLNVIALSNGNFVVRSTGWDNGAEADAGAVTWGDGTSGIVGVVSAANSLVGSTAGDQIGYDQYGVTPLSNGNYVVSSRYWDNGPTVDAGAVTWGDGTTGITGVVSVANSLVGSTAGDQIGYGRLTALSNGNYVVGSLRWDNGTVVDAGAVTWGDGTTGTTGVVSEANSLVGSSDGDQVGNWGVKPLSNGNYVVDSWKWDNGAIVDAGAVTWGDGMTGVSGAVSAANSLVGSTDEDRIGGVGIRPLSNGNYVVRSPSWDSGATANVGAVTWGDGTTGIVGPISAANSMVGSSAGDNVGGGVVVVLSNGNYVWRSSSWDSGATADAGAVTWGDGATGTVGVVSEANSLVGSTADDLDWAEVLPLSNGNYVVRSIYWDNGPAADAGAVTWGDGTTGVTGTISAANSLVGSTAGDSLSSYTTALSNGNYVVSLPYWDNGSSTDVGAATWGDGTSGVVGPVSAANSLVGGTANDKVGYSSAIALSNGNYVVVNRYWDNGSMADAGAVTWGDGTSGVVGPVSAANSLVGGTANDLIGDPGARALSNGNYVVISRYWDNGGTVDAGAVTWGDGTSGVVGPVSAANSLVGSTAGDQVGYSAGFALLHALSNGDYIVASVHWDNGAIADAGAVTWGNGTIGNTGPITPFNSVLGTATGGGSSMWWGGYDSVNDQLVVGRPAENIVTLFRPLVVRHFVFLPVILKNAP